MGRLAAVKRWMYRRGRPGRVTAWINRGWAQLASAGRGPAAMVTLEVKGRRSGRLTSFPLMVADYQGERYLVSMLGEGSNWVANVRAAKGRVVLRRGHREEVQLEEVDPRERAPILRRYLQIADGARAHVAVDRHAPLEEFERAASDYPVFRVRPLRAPTQDLPPASPPR